MEEHYKFGLGDIECYKPLLGNKEIKAHLYHLVKKTRNYSFLLIMLINKRILSNKELLLWTAT